MNTTPILSGQLVRLSAPLPEDYPIIAGWSRNETFHRLSDDDPMRPLTPDDIPRPQVSHDSFGFHIRTLAEDKLIGTAGLFMIKWTHRTAMFGIGIGEPDYWGKGYGREATALIITYAFRELNLYRVSLGVFSYNTRAIQAYEKLGFVLEGRVRGAILRDGERHDVLNYGILYEEWLKTQ